jgi:hypothetical protein
VPPQVREAVGTRDSDVLGGTTRGSHHSPFFCNIFIYLSKMFFLFTADGTGEKGTSQPPLPHTHTHFMRVGRPLFRALPTLLIPPFSDAPKAGTSRPPRVGGPFALMPAWNEGRVSSALHEPHCGSSTSTGVGTSSLCMWLQTNKHTGRQDYQYQPLSPTAVGPSQSREVHSYLVMCPVTIQSTRHVFWNMKGRSSFSAVVMNLALGLRLSAVSPKVLAAL